MKRVVVELSGESPELAQAEVVATTETLGGRAVAGPVPGSPLALVEVPDGSVQALAERLALARRCLVEVEEGSLATVAAWRPDAAGTSAAFRRIGRPSSGGDDPAIRAAATAWKAAGGTIDLDRPTRRFWLATQEPSTTRLLEELAAVDRRAVATRRISALPFHRPVGLAPRLARAAANLAHLGSGDRVLDPFLGTGALLAEAALLGAHVYGIDREPTMVQGALRNFAHLGVTAHELVVGDAGDVEFPGSAGPFEALLTDPPYGRASSTGGEASAELLARVLPRWAARVRPSGRVVVVVPGGPDPLPEPWRREVSVPVRVHRSLTREFRVYRRPA
jgi:tRNA (guanine10-N2)-dimethyltransferase